MTGRHGLPEAAPLAQALAARLALRPGAWSTSSPFPPSRGLKTSSAAAAALARAALAAEGRAPLADEELERACVDASLQAGVTLTGAFDDQVACVRGGCHLADNRARRTLARLRVPDWHVAVWVPAHGIPKRDVRGIDASAVRKECEDAEASARRGDVAAALTANGAAFVRLYAAHGLPVTARPAEVALAHGADGAGLSGTGPAVAALFTSPVRLPEVAGGTWVWSRVAA
ncbi:MAG TPA: shikimate kinase [Candidatus Thermoplasmatota archaeon]|nr:shikimate kinase [Candidatus Thermoplasmatota archaeon]